ncbi:arylformamidase [Bacillus sp. FSL W7-1360]
MTWIDISQPLSASIAHWPGDTPFSYRLVATKEMTGSVNVGSIHMSAHTGTHVDAPFHFDDNGDRIDELPLSTYIGDAYVIEAIGVKEISQSLLEGIVPKNTKRLLVKTKTQTNEHIFPDTLPAVTPEAAAYLQTMGVILLGVDVPSVDEPTSKELAGHHALAKAGIAILENIQLAHVTSGYYELIALPLRLVGADGSPVRAVLRPIQSKE